MTNKKSDSDSLINITDDIEAAINLGLIATMSEEDLDAVFNEVFKDCRIIDLNSSKNKD